MLKILKIIKEMLKEEAKKIMKKTIEDIEKIYDLEIKKIIKIIKTKKLKKILLQFPEGMKQYSQVICDEIENKTNCNCFIWMGSCFGACDIPLETKNLKIDLIIQFGHSKWKTKTV